MSMGENISSISILLRAPKTVKAAKQIAIKIVEWKVWSRVNLGGDSTNINTGWEGGSFNLIDWLMLFAYK